MNPQHAVEKDARFTCKVGGVRSVKFAGPPFFIPCGVAVTTCDTEHS